MYVTECSIGMHNMDPTSARDEMMQYGKPQTEGKRPSNSIAQLRTIAGLCNSGEFDASTSGLPLHERKINGDATDQAILRFSESLGPVTELRQMWKKSFELAFNSKNRYMIRTLELVQPEGLDLALSTAEAASFHPKDT
jgi:sodium/potassium-transporting ATPase subunit alpha